MLHCVVQGAIFGSKNFLHNINIRFSFGTLPPFLPCSNLLGRAFSTWVRESPEFWTFVHVGPSFLEDCLNQRRHVHSCGPDAMHILHWSNGSIQSLTPRGRHWVWASWQLSMSHAHLHMPDHAGKLGLCLSTTSYQHSCICFIDLFPTEAPMKPIWNNLILKTE